MQNISADIAPKHGRLFELIRQKNQADTVVARAVDYPNRRISANELLVIQQAAAKSLQAQA